MYQPRRPDHSSNQDSSKKRFSRPGSEPTGRPEGRTGGYSRNTGGRSDRNDRPGSARPGNRGNTGPQGNRDNRFDGRPPGARPFSPNDRNDGPPPLRDSDFGGRPNFDNRGGDRSRPESDRGDNRPNGRDGGQGRDGFNDRGNDRAGNRPYGRDSGQGRDGFNDRGNDRSGNRPYGRDGGQGRNDSNDRSSYSRSDDRGQGRNFNNGPRPSQNDRDGGRNFTPRGRDDNRDAGRSGRYESRDRDDRNNSGPNESRYREQNNDRPNARYQNNDRPEGGNGRFESRRNDSNFDNGYSNRGFQSEGRRDPENERFAPRRNDRNHENRGPQSYERDDRPRQEDPSRQEGGFRDGRPTNRPARPTGPTGRPKPLQTGRKETRNAGHRRLPAALVPPKAIGSLAEGVDGENDVDTDDDGRERLHVRIAHSGFCSRRAAEKLILEGRVTVNGGIVETQGMKVAHDDDVRVDGQPIVEAKLYTLILNKPTGCVTTLFDPQHRQTIVKFLPDLGVQLKPVGRLDMDTEGLLIVTNDGLLAQRLAHPRYGVEKEYQAIVNGIPDEKALDKLRNGIYIEGGKTAPAKVEVIHAEPTTNTTGLRITLHEGRKRQIRLMCEAAGYPIKSLKRLRIGPLYVKGMRAGECRMLMKAEIDQLKKLVGLD